MKESKKYIEEILEDIKQRLNMLYDSVDLYFLSFIEKANFNSTLDDYFYEIKILTIMIFGNTLKVLLL